MEPLNNSTWIKGEVFQEIFPKTPSIELLSLRAYNEPVALWPPNQYCLRCIRVGTLPIVAQTLQRNRPAYNPLGIPSATAEADNIIKRLPSSLYFQDFSEVPDKNFPQKRPFHNGRKAEKRADYKGDFLLLRFCLSGF